MNGDNLVNAVASVHQNTIVVVNSVGPLNVESWIDNPNVTAVSGSRLLFPVVRIHRVEHGPPVPLGPLGGPRWV